MTTTAVAEMPFESTEGLNQFVVTETSLLSTSSESIDSTASSTTTTSNACGGTHPHSDHQQAWTAAILSCSTTSSNTSEPTNLWELLSSIYLPFMFLWVRRSMFGTAMFIRSIVVGQFLRYVVMETTTFWPTWLQVLVDDSTHKAPVPPALTFLALLTLVALVVHPDGLTWVFLGKIVDGINAIWKGLVSCWTVLLDDYGIFTSLMALLTLMSLGAILFLLLQSVWKSSLSNRRRRRNSITTCSNSSSISGANGQHQVSANSKAKKKKKKWKRATRHHHHNHHTNHSHTPATVPSTPEPIPEHEPAGNVPTEGPIPTTATDCTTGNNMVEAKEEAVATTLTDTTRSSISSIDTMENDDHIVVTRNLEVELASAAPPPGLETVTPSVGITVSCDELSCDDSTSVRSYASAPTAVVTLGSRSSTASSGKKKSRHTNSNNNNAHYSSSNANNSSSHGFYSSLPSTSNYKRKQTKRGNRNQNNQYQPNNNSHHNHQYVPGHYSPDKVQHRAQRHGCRDSLDVDNGVRRPCYTPRSSRYHKANTVRDGNKSNFERNAISSRNINNAINSQTQFHAPSFCTNSANADFTRESHNQHNSSYCGGGTMQPPVSESFFSSSFQIPASTPSPLFSSSANASSGSELGIQYGGDRSNLLKSSSSQQPQPFLRPPPGLTRAPPAVNTTACVGERDFNIVPSLAPFALERTTPPCLLAPPKPHYSVHTPASSSSHVLNGGRLNDVGNHHFADFSFGGSMREEDESRIEAELQELGGRVVGSVLDF